MKGVLIDLTGQRFTRLLVIRRVPSKNPSRTQATWECLCDCGAITLSIGTTLRSGESKSCGCLRDERFASLKSDIADLRVGMLVAIEPCERPKGVSKGNYWRCACDCGGEAVVRANAFKYGQIKSCGCLRKRSTFHARRDLTGDRFGRLVAMEKLAAVKQQGHSYRCLCDCGETVVARGKDIASGITTSCGCARSAAIVENAMQSAFNMALVPMRHGDAIARDAA